MATATLVYNGTSVSVDSEQDDCSTIGEAFDLFRDILGLPANVTPIRNGEPADLDDEFEDEDELSAARPDGNKGR